MEKNIPFVAKAREKKMETFEDFVKALTDKQLIQFGIECMGIKKGKLPKTRKYIILKLLKEHRIFDAKKSPEQSVLGTIETIK